MTEQAKHTAAACEHEWLSRFCAPPFCEKCRLILGSRPNAFYLDPLEEAAAIARTEGRS